MMTVAREKEIKHGRTVGNGGAGAGRRYHFKEDDQERPH